MALRFLFALALTTVVITGAADAKLPTNARAVRDDTSPHKGPVQLTLLEVDRPAYRLGDGVAYRVLLRNTGAEPVALTGCAIGLNVRDAHSDPNTRPRQITAAARAPSSTTTIAARASVDLSLRGTWRFQSTAIEIAFAALLPRLVELRAALSSPAPTQKRCPAAPLESITNAWVLLQP
jgi:hypothetical protein